MIWEIGVIAQKLINRIHDRELHNILVLFGGTISKDDIAVLRNIGVQGVFPSHPSSRKSRHSTKKK